MPDQVETSTEETQVIEEENQTDSQDQNSKNTQTDDSTTKTEGSETEESNESNEQKESHDLDSENSKEEKKPIDFKAESRKWENRSKENLQALENLQAEHAETRKQLEELETLRQEISELKSSASKSAIGKEHGIPDDLLSFLSGSEEDMKKQAETLSASIGQKPPVVSRLQGNTDHSTEDGWAILEENMKSKMMKK